MSTGGFMLSHRTRELAGPMLRGELAHHYRYLDPAPDFESLAGLSPHKRYAALARIAAERAPLLIRPCERIAGAATLLEGAEHRFFDMASISHTTVGFGPVMQLGLSGLEAKIRLRLQTADPAGRDFLESSLLCLDALRLWNRRYVQALDERIAGSQGAVLKAYAEVRANMSRVPEHPPCTFHEAVQSFWTLYAFMRLLGNWSGLGRLDEILGPYLKRDLETGLLTLDEARDILAHFFIRGTEWTGLFGSKFHWGGSGDKQYYQNILIGGINQNGSEITNEVSYLVLDIVEELGISDFPISVRFNRNSPERLVRRSAEVIRKGGGIVAWYDEEKVIDALTRFGFPVEEARTFTNDGCWEAIIGGKSAFSYSSFDLLPHLQTALVEAAANNDDFEGLYSRFRKGICAEINTHRAQRTEKFMRSAAPAPFLSLFVEGCIEKARGYTDRGAKYSIHALHAGGMPDAANALTAIQKLVYADRVLTLKEMADIVRNDWEGREDFRLALRRTLPRYGNDEPAADGVMKRIFDDFTSEMASVREINGVLLPAGLSTFGRQLEWRERRWATPDGFKKGAILSGNASPAPGTATRGPTAILCSAGKLDYSRLPNGCALDISLDPGSLQDEAGLGALCGLMRGSLETGVFLVQVNVIDPELLRKAQEYPEHFPELTVRVSGWSARFITLGRHWQAMIIGRLENEGRCAPAPIILPITEKVC